MGNFNPGNTWVDNVQNLHLLVGLGLIPGWEGFRKFGMNPAIDTGTEQVWPPGTIQVLPAAAGVVTAVSDSADDVMTTGTGGWLLTVEGLDADYVPVTETFEMNGLTGVVGTTAMLRIVRSYFISAGTGEQNAGNISMTIGGDLQSYIEATEGQCHCAQYTVPADKLLVLDSYIVTAGRQNTADLAVQFQIKSTGANQIWRSFSDVYPYETQYVQYGNTTIVIPEKTDIRILATATANGLNASAEYSGFLIDPDTWIS